MILFHQRGKAQKSFNKTKEISTYTLPDDNGTLAIAENIGSTATIALVEKPFILYPSNGSSEYNNSITISQYVNNYLYTGTKTHTTIQVSTDSNFNNIVVNNFIPDTNTNARDISLPLDYSNTTLYIRIRYHSGDYCSMWSEIVSVRTKTFTVSIPTILTPSSSLEATPVNLLITTGNFNYIGVSDTHYSTHYQVSTNEAFTSLYYNVESTTSLKSAATTLEEGVTYYIRVRYRGTKYGYSAWSNVVKISTLVPYVHVPTILTPSNNSTGISNTLSISTDVFKFTGVSDTHMSTHYQISTVSNFTSTIVDSEDTTNKTSRTIVVGEGVTYYIRVRYRGTKYGYSAWSNVVKISTLVPYVHVPTILTPSNNSTGISNTLSISTDVFKFTGVSDTHMSTHYQISTVSNFTSTIVDSEDTTNKTSKSIVVGEGVTYYIRVRYRGTKYGYSAWSNVVKISTLVPYVHVPTILTPSNNSTDLDKNITIVSNAFKFTGVSDAHYSTHYQVSTNVDMTALVYNEEIVGNQLNHTIPLQEGTTYYMRIRYRGTKYGYSSWSNVIRVSTLVPIVGLILGTVSVRTDGNGHLDLNLVNNTHSIYAHNAFSATDFSYISYFSVEQRNSLYNYNEIYVEIVDYINTEGRSAYTIVRKATKANGFVLGINLIEYSGWSGARFSLKIVGVG